MPVSAEVSKHGASGQDGSQYTESNNTLENGVKANVTPAPAPRAFTNVAGQPPGPSSGAALNGLNNVTRSSFDSITRILTNGLRVGSYDDRNSNISSASSSMSELFNSANNFSDSSGASRHGLNLPVGGNIGPCPSNSNSSSDSEYEPGSNDFIRAKNRKNIFKTLEGQAGIITNWSLKENDPRKVWILMGGNPYDKVIRMHGGNTGSSQPGRMLDKAFRDVTTEDRELQSESSDSASLSVIDELEPMTTSRGTSASISVVDESVDYSNCDANDSQQQSASGHGEKRNRVYSCSRCLPTTYYMNKYYWCKHVMSEHGREFRTLEKDNLYQCSTCQKVFGQKRSRADHAKIHALSQCDGGNAVA
ncbi:Ras-responsive element-binding protein 1 [Orchesella cincta]|uniref:Ras-responsive element-binding protein 1 n=1 Tax=Orchesella cincta TaxID=48709 RepID=A0A1D2MEF8_ORCCI|nr:Ras-responsive element-binding protein 1 [Orchesella cincta]